jgi:NitT/TauT family transport system permease protein
VPPFSAVLAALGPLLTSTEFFRDAVMTLFRFAAGYLGGCAAGLALGLFLGLSRRGRDALEPTIEVLRPIPATAVVPVAILFLGLDSAMVIAVVAYAVTWPVLLNTVDGVRGVDPILLDTGRVFGFRGRSLERRVLLPASLPQVATGMRISLAIGLVLVIVVEMLVGDRGLGHRVIEAERSFRFPEMYATILLIGAIGAGLNAAFVALRRRVLRWYVGWREVV